MHPSTASPSHHIALALAIVMRENHWAAPAAARHLRDTAASSELTLEQAAAVVIATGTAVAPAADRLRDARITVHTDLVDTARHAFEIRMRENAIDAQDAAALIAVQAVRHGLSIVELTHSIVDAANRELQPDPKIPREPIPHGQHAVTADHLQQFLIGDLQ